MADDVQLTDLLVIQRYSLAVRSTTVPREELLAALQADLDWLRGGRQVPAAAAVNAKAAPARASAKARAPRTARAPVARSPRA